MLFPSFSVKNNLIQWYNAFGDEIMRRFFDWLFPPTAVAAVRNWHTRLHDAVLFLLMFAAAISVSIPLSTLFDDNNHFSMAVFILVVAVIARFTEGYFWGVAASILAVWCVNYIFTYPYWAFNMSLMGYPLNFAAMLAVSLIISALTTQNKRQAQLEMEAEMEKTRANLLRSVSHDLRTPLTTIIGFSSVLMESDNLSPAEQKELAASIHRDARWLARVTENILSVTKVSGSDFALKKEPEVVEEIIGSAIGKFRKNHPDIAVNVRKPQEILLAPMDATLIEQVLLNLLDNAAVHGQTTTRIIITLQRAAKEIRITIADNGEGIAPQILPRLFDGSAATTQSADAKRNMGIGLSVCRSIITAHSGSIYATDTGHGASITFTLPVNEE